MIHKKLIKIDGNEYTLKSHSYRAMFLFEELAMKPVAEIKSMQDQVTFIYCILKTSNDDFHYSLEQFFEILDEDDGIMLEFLKLAESATKKK